MVKGVGGPGRRQREGAGDCEDFKFSLKLLNKIFFHRLKKISRQFQ